MSNWPYEKYWVGLNINLTWESFIKKRDVIKPFKKQWLAENIPLNVHLSKLENYTLMPYLLFLCF
ncbi:MAG: hypothetical protein VR65_22580 [Desulfobulbaceae bacterium BRH_c16a]|nr:MAG: hypothetical protein VR65_22580 [Desulfobulbaceae bacterium BRH_c16a]